MTIKVTKVTGFYTCYKCKHYKEEHWTLDSICFPALCEKCGNKVEMRCWVEGACKSQPSFVMYDDSESE